MRRRSSGFTLIEMLVSIGALIVIFSISGMVFAEIVRTRGGQERYMQRRDAALHLMRLIAQQVRESSEFVEAEGDMRAGADILMFRHDGDLLVYRSEPGIVRLIQSGESEKTESTVLQAEGVNVSFKIEGGPSEARSVVITSEWPEHPRVGISRPMLSLRATRRVQP